MSRLKEVANDAGKIITRHAFLRPDEAGVILREIQRLQAEVRQLQRVEPVEEESVDPVKTSRTNGFGSRKLLENFTSETL
jgi:hypothetical protein